MKSTLCVIAMCLLTVLHGVASGQESTSGTIEGTVEDAQGVPLPGVTVTLSSSEGPKTRTTDVDGRFIFAQLPAGIYTLKAQIQGFNTVQREQIDVRLGSRLRLDVVMTAGVQEKIEVIGQAPIVDLSTTTTGATFTQEMMKSIPVGRNFSSTLALAPGVVGSGIPGAVNPTPPSPAPAASKTSTSSTE